MLAHLRKPDVRFAGRVGFIRLDAEPREPAQTIDLHGQPAVMGRADEFVETSEQFSPLATRLLGRTWFVESLTDALKWQQQVGRELSFVTREGQIVGPNGTLAVGPGNSSAGLISRRSELRALRQQISQIDIKLVQSGARCQALENQLDDHQELEQRLAADYQKIQEELGEHRLLTGAAEERAAQVAKQCTAIEAELGLMVSEHQGATQALADAKSRLASTENHVAELELKLQIAQANADEVEQARQRHGRETNASKIELAKNEQQLESLRRSNLQPLSINRERAPPALADSHQQLQACSARGRLAEPISCVLKQKLQSCTFARRCCCVTGPACRWPGTRREQKGRLSIRCEIPAAYSQTRNQAPRQGVGGRRNSPRRAPRQPIHSAKIMESSWRRWTSPRPAPIARAGRRGAAEIGELAKLNSIGGVNSYALEELEQLEARDQSLSSQFHDLATAKASLERNPTGKINADSRRLFAETSEVVPRPFRFLVRKLFGGGQPTSVLDEAVDILDSGIEIVLCPPRQRAAKYFTAERR